MGMIVDFLNHNPFADMYSGLAFLPPLPPPNVDGSGVDGSGRVVPETDFLSLRST